MSAARVRIEGATALVTGATGGLGQAIAAALHERGAQLILSGRRREPLEAIAAPLAARTIVADLALRADVDRLAAEAGNADILIANAALPATGQLPVLSPEQVDRMLDVNLRAPIVLARALGPRMAQRGGGQIVLVSSLSGKAASPASSMYSATKFGLRGFGLALRQDLARDQVGVSVISPGFIRDAGMFHDSGVRTLPPGVGTRAPGDVAAAVIRAIEQDRAELDVAPPAMRVGAAVASVAPGLAERAARAMGSHRLAATMADAQADKR